MRQEPSGRGPGHALRRLLRAVLSRYDLLAVLLVLVALYVFVFRLHLVPLPDTSALRSVACPSGSHAAHPAAPGCPRLTGG